MKDYDVVYIDKEGDKQDFVVTATDTRVAISNTIELCPDCRRVIRCSPKPMFERLMPQSVTLKLDCKHHDCCRQFVLAFNPWRFY